MPPTGHSTSQPQRYLALAGLVAPVVFAIGVVVAGQAWEGYSHRTQNISDLGGTEAPVAILQNANFVVFGVLVGAVAVALRQRRAEVLAAGVSSLLIAYFGVTLVVQGLTPCTPGCAEGTVLDVVHGLAATTGFLAFAVAALLLWRRTRSEPDWASYATVSGLAGVVTLVFFVAWFVASAVDPAGLHGGALQRMSVGPVLVWLGVTGARLLRPPVEPPPTVQPSAGSPTG